MCFALMVEELCQRLEALVTLEALVGSVFSAVLHLVVIAVYEKRA